MNIADYGDIEFSVAFFVVVRRIQNTKSGDMQTKPLQRNITGRFGFFF